MYLELHDSVLSGLKQDGGTAVLQLRPAYVHRSAGRPGIDPGEVYTQDFDIVIEGAQLTEDGPAVPFVVWDGAVAFGDRELVNLVPGDLHGTKPVFLRLVPAAGHRDLQIGGCSIDIHPVGQAQYMDEFHG